MGSKNYSYDKEDVATKEIVGRVTKIRGMTLRGPSLKAIDTNQMLDFVGKMQEDQKVEKAIPQQRLKINNVSKTICATEVKSLYSNFSNEKSFWPRKPIQQNFGHMVQLAMKQHKV